MLHFVLALLISVCACILLQRVSLGRHSQDFVFADLVACLCGAFVFGFFEILTSRPYFALYLTLCLFLLLCVLNCAKRRALRDESLVFSDIALAGQLARFPALYLPFLPCKALLAAALVFLPVSLAIFLLGPVYEAKGLSLLLLSPFPLLFVASHTFFKETLRLALRRCHLSFSADDARRFGPLGACLLHIGWHLLLRGVDGGICGPREKPFARPLCAPAMSSLTGQRPECLPDLFLIQEESFCDPRLFLPALPSDLLANYDRLRAEGVSFNLAVHAYGAYTMRTEYEVLTSIEPKDLGSCVFHPYFTVAREPSWSCVRFLKKLGYRTICVHPFARDFFYRRRAIPNLGFDEFIALDSFPHPTCFGPYVTDAAVADCLLDLQRTMPEPLFCFAITMENHGPWGEGRFDPKLQPKTLPDLDGDIERYLVHIRHADAMFGTLAQGLQESGRSALLGVYGDHLPGLPALVPQGASDTPCFLWATAKIALDGDAKRLSPAQWMAAYLRAAGLVAEAKAKNERKAQDSVKAGASKTASSER